MGLEVTVTVRGLDRVTERLDRVSGARIKRAVQRALVRVAREIARDAKGRAPEGHGETAGSLRRAIYYEPVGDDGARVVAPAINGVPYPFWIHEGTGVHGPRGSPITPKRGRFLVFKTYGLKVSASGKARTTSKLVFARRVMGVRPNPFMRKALEHHEPVIPLAVAEAVNAAWNGGEASS